MSGTLLPKPEQLIDLVGHIGAIKLTMDGAFDKRIAELKSATAEHDAKLGAVKTVEDAKRVREEADQYAEKIRAACLDAATKANEKLGQVVARESAVSGREATVSSREAAVDARTAALDQRESAIDEKAKNIEKALQERETTLKNKEADYAQRADKLAKDIAAFNKRLDALRV